MVIASRVDTGNTNEFKESIASRRSLAEGSASKDLQSYRSEFLERSRRESVEKLSQSDIPPKLINSLRSKAEDIVNNVKGGDLGGFTEYCKNTLHLVDDRAIKMIYGLADSATPADHKKAIELTALLLNPSYGNLPIMGATSKALGDRQVERLFTRYEIKKGDYSSLREAVQNDEKYDCSGIHSRNAKRSRERAKERILNMIDSAEMKGDAALDDRSIAIQRSRVDSALELFDQDISFDKKVMMAILPRNSSGVATILNKWGNNGAFKEHIATVRESYTELAKIDQEIVEQARVKAFRTTASRVATDMKHAPEQVGSAAREVYYDAVYGNATGPYAEALRGADQQLRGAPIAAKVSPISFNIDNQLAERLIDSIQRGGSSFGAITEHDLHNMLHYIGSMPDPGGRGAAHAASLIPEGSDVSSYHKLRVEGFYRFVEKYANQSILNGEHRSFDNVLAFLKNDNVRAILHGSVGISPQEIDRTIARGAQVVPGIAKGVQDHMRVIDMQIDRLNKVTTLSLSRSVIEAIQNRMQNIKKYRDEKGADTPEGVELNEFIKSRERIFNSFKTIEEVAYSSFKQFLALDKQKLTDVEKHNAIQAIKLQVINQLGPEGMQHVVNYAKKNWNNYDIKQGKQDPLRRKKLDEFFALGL